MANTITFIQPVQIALRNSGVGAKMVRMGVVMDTISSDFDIYTPATGSHAAIMGIVYGETTASNITVKSGATTLCVMERSTNSFLVIPTDRPILIGGKGETLKLNVSVAITGAIYLTIAEFKMLTI